MAIAKRVFEIVFVLLCLVGVVIGPSVQPALARQQPDKMQPLKRIEPMKPHKDFSGPIPETRLAQKDIGVDYVVVIASRANLRDRPDIAANILLTLSKGDVLVLLGSAWLGTWFNVIHVESGKEGWVHASTAAVNYTQNRKPLLQIPGTATASSTRPELEVTNDTSKVLTLKIEDMRYVFGPGEKKTVSLIPGHYKFVASAPAVIPDFGEQSFETGYEYFWRFYIVTR